MKYTLILFFSSVLLAFATQAEAQHNKSYIYGTVFMESGEKFTGFMRWGKEEMFWHDIFNSTKVGNKYVESPKANKKSRWIDFDWDISSLWEDKYRTTSHTFACFYGDIKTIHIKSSSKLKIDFKNGVSQELSGGSNDIGANIYMSDYELGKIKLTWNKIKKIAFSEAPESIDSPDGKALFGTVNTRRASFTGYIKWDLDERVSTDIMNGDSKHGDQEIPFKNIRRIEKLDRGVLLTFKSGRTIELSGSNDCNSENRGIAIAEAGLGSVEVSWKAFNSIEFGEPDCEVLGYNDYEEPHGIHAEVYTYNGQKHSGLIVFDIDEMWELEFLDGTEDKIDYQIPFRNIERIVPKNDAYSMIYLKDGKQILIGGKQDVSQKNDGILVFVNDQKEPAFVEWDDIDEIIIK